MGDGVMTRLEALQKIVDEKSMGKVEGIEVDLYSASAYLQVQEILNDSNKEKLAALPVDQAIGAVFMTLDRYDKAMKA